MHPLGHAFNLHRPISLLHGSGFSQSVNSLRPVFLTERKPTWAKPAHPDNIDKLGRERMNWLALCSSQLDYQPLYIFLRIVTHMYHIYIYI